MNISELLSDKTLKPKQKTETLSQAVLDGSVSVKDLLDFASKAKDSPKATCIEALEFATKNKPELATLECLHFVTAALGEKAPRVKWEAAKVIGNIAPLFPSKLDKAISSLLINSEHPGTVVRWSAAFALGQILKTKHPSAKMLIPAVEAICLREEKNSIKKIYLDALKKIKS